MDNASTISRTLRKAMRVTLAAMFLPYGVFAQVPVAPEYPKLPTESDRPKYNLLRYEEDWSFLQDRSLQQDWLDSVKYIPLGKAEGNRHPYVSIGGDTRQTFERSLNDSFTNVPYPINSFPLQRYMLHFDLHLDPRVRVFLQFESAAEEGRRGGYRPVDEKRLDFLNAFVDLNVGASEHPVTLRIGREEFNLGSGRFLAVREGPNVRQGFYGFRLDTKLGSWATTGFAVRPAADKPGFFDNVPLHTTQFWGVFAERPWGKQKNKFVDAYYFGIDNKQATFNQGTGREVRHTVGARMVRPPPASPGDHALFFHYDVEAAYQFGSFGTGDIRAWIVANELGFILQKVPFAPRIGLRTDISSGDKDLNDKRLQTFNPLFQLGNYFGIISNGGPGPINFVGLHPDLKLFLPHAINFEAGDLIAWRQSVNDGLYSVPGNVLIPSGASKARYVGHRPGVEARWQIDRHFFIQGDYAVFFGGPFQRETGHTKNFNYTSVWTGFEF